MPKTPATKPKGPLKAYQIFVNDWFAGIVVAHTNAKARARFALGDGRDRAGNKWRGLRSCLLRNQQEAAKAIEQEEDAGKYWRDTRAFARLQAQADDFNARYSVGHPVRVVGCCEAEQWPDGLTVTRTPAWATQGSVLVSVEGQAGGMYLKYIQPVSDFSHV